MISFKGCDRSLAARHRSTSLSVRIEVYFLFEVSWTDCTCRVSGHLTLSAMKISQKVLWYMLFIFFFCYLKSSILYFQNLGDQHRWKDFQLVRTVFELHERKDTERKHLWKANILSSRWFITFFILNNRANWFLEFKQVLWPHGHTYKTIRFVRT